MPVYTSHSGVCKVYILLDHMLNVSFADLMGNIIDNKPFNDDF